MRVKLNELRSIILEALLNAYDVLGLKPGASEDEIKRAWKMLAIKNHPDRGGSHGAMVDINKAKERLLDPVELGKRGPIFPGYEVAGAKPTPQPAVAKPQAAPPPPAAEPPRAKRPSPDADDGQYSRGARHYADRRQVVGKAKCPFCGSTVNTVMDKDWGEVYANHIDMASYMKNLCSGGGQHVETRHKVKDDPKKAAPPPPPNASAKSRATPPPPPPAAEPAAAKGRGDKESYKVYPYAGQRRVMRIKGKLYGTGEGGRLPDGNVTKFNAHDRANVKRDGERIKVTNPDTGHSQTWDPIDEVRSVVDDIIIEMLTKIGERK